MLVFALFVSFFWCSHGVPIQVDEAMRLSNLFDSLCAYNEAGISESTFFGCQSRTVFSTHDCTLTSAGKSQMVCNEDGNVVALLARDSNLKGFFPETGLSSFKSLEQALFQNNEIVGNFPRLPINIQILDISNNQMVGTVPEIPLFVKQFKVYGNRFIGPAPLYTMLLMPISGVPCQLLSAFQLSNCFSVCPNRENLCHSVGCADNSSCSVEAVLSQCRGCVNCWTNSCVCKPGFSGVLCDESVDQRTNTATTQQLERTSAGSIDVPLTSTFSSQNSRQRQVTDTPSSEGLATGIIIAITVTGIVFLLIVCSIIVCAFVVKKRMKPNNSSSGGGASIKMRQQDDYSRPPAPIQVYEGQQDDYSKAPKPNHIYEDGYNKPPAPVTY